MAQPCGVAALRLLDAGLSPGVYVKHLLLLLNPGFEHVAWMVYVRREPFDEEYSVNFARINIL